MSLRLIAVTLPSANMYIVSTWSSTWTSARQYREFFPLPGLSNPLIDLSKNFVCLLIASLFQWAPLGHLTRFSASSCLITSQLPNTAISASAIPAGCLDGQQPIITNRQSASIARHATLARRATLASHARQMGRTPGYIWHLSAPCHVSLPKKMILPNYFR